MWPRMPVATSPGAGDRATATSAVPASQLAARTALQRRPRRAW
jgi:hypothetical protein